MQLVKLCKWALLGAIGALGVINGAAAEPPLRPYEGMWYPFAQPGSGFVLDQEQDTLVIAFFTYEDGEPAWYLASGSLEDGVFEADSQRFEGGSCLGCEHRAATAGDGPSIRLELVGRTTAWLTVEGGEPVPVTALPFGSPIFLHFGPEGGPHGQASMYDMSGRWVFAGGDSADFPFDMDISVLAALDPGGWRWEESFDAVPDNVDPWAFRCFSPGPEDVNPQCQVVSSASEIAEIERPLSAFWADQGPNQVLGYTSPKLEPEDTAVRGTGFVHGFRLTGPLFDTGDDAGDLDHMDDKPGLYLDKGMWYEPGKPGSGVTLDWQNDLVVATFFSYRADGEPIWFQGSGIVEDGVVEFDLTSFDNGSCFNCEYREPEAVLEAENARIEFVSRSTARLTIGEREDVPLRKLAFDSPVHRPFDAPGEFGTPALYDLRGRWFFVDVLGSEVFHRTVEFTRPIRRDDGELIGWTNESRDATFRCRATGDASEPRCILIAKPDGEWRTLVTTNWANVGSDQIVGERGPGFPDQEEDPPPHPVVFGFRMPEGEPDDP